MGKGNTLQGLHVVSILTVIFFILTLCGTVSAGQLYVNETGWWPAGGIELNVSSNCSYTNWSTTYPNETFIFALCDILYPDTGGWYGYKTYTAGENDSENNQISHNLTVIDYHVSTYSDYNYSTNPNDYQKMRDFAVRHGYFL